MGGGSSRSPFHNTLTGPTRAGSVGGSVHVYDYVNDHVHVHVNDHVHVYVYDYVHVDGEGKEARAYGGGRAVISGLDVEVFRLVLLGVGGERGLVWVAAALAGLALVLLAANPHLLVFGLVGLLDVLFVLGQLATDLLEPLGPGLLVGPLDRRCLAGPLMALEDRGDDVGRDRGHNMLQES